ncbi:unnamed protein product [Gongylonema pulchrum]|uniref:Uncharacterized protein n=1 Tax=Gongylonema pulchrum TaxID=637853 RepID=A0A3P6RQ74_9BILA|nr:unnamed protein product [Gongylonema pulchrum]
MICRSTNRRSLVINPNRKVVKHQHMNSEQLKRTLYLRK